MTATLCIPYMATHSLTGRAGAKWGKRTVNIKRPISAVYLNQLIDHVLERLMCPGDDQKILLKEIRAAVTKRLGTASDYLRKYPTNKCSTQRM